MDSLSAAKVFLIARGRVDDENRQEDTLALATLLELFAKAGFVKGLTKAKEIHQNSISNETFEININEMIERYKT